MNRNTQLHGIQREILPTKHLESFLTVSSLCVSHNEALELLFISQNAYK